MNEYPESYSSDGKKEWSTRPRQLSRGEKVEYRLVGIKPSPLDRTGKTLGIPFITGIPKRDTVFIPFPDAAKKSLIKEGDNREGEFIDIGYAVGNRMDTIHFLKSRAGVLSLTGGNAKNQDLFEFLESCNANGSNPNRDTSKEPKFQKINVKEEAKVLRQARKDKRAAEDKAEKLTRNELLRVAIGLGYNNPESQEEESLRDSIESYAGLNPINFLVLVENPDLVIQEIAVAAESKGFISVNLQKRSIMGNNGETLYTWSPEKDAKWAEKFVDFVKSKEGSKFYSSLKEQMKISN